MPQRVKPAEQGIVLDALSAGYGQTLIVDDINLTIPTGKMTVLAGANGSGKSTLLSTIARMLKPLGGCVRLDGQAIHQMPTKAVSRQLGILPQSPLTPEGLTVFELVSRGRYPWQGLMRQWSEADELAVEEALRLTGTAEFAHLPVDSLSGGQRQRCWIAMALAQQTATILLDEPTTWLDLRYQVDILELLQTLTREHGRTVVTVLHDLNFAVNYADLLVFLKQGRIAGTISDNDVCSPELIKRVFDVDVQMSINPQTGKPFFMPFRARRQRHNERGHPAFRAASPPRLALLLLTLLLIAASLVHLGLGARWIAPQTVLQALLEYNPRNFDQRIIVDLRLVRLAAALLTGAALGVAGLLLQTVIRNPLGEPHILGLNAGASLAVVATSALGLSLGAFPAGRPLTAACGAGLLFGGVMALASAGRGGATPLRITLCGVALSAFASAVTAAILILDEQTLLAMRTWLAGDLAGLNWSTLQTALVPALIGLGVALLIAPRLNVLALGDKVALGLGINLVQTRLLGLLAIALLCGAAVAVAGPIGFVGLVVPHVVRRLVTEDIRLALPLAAPVGALVLVLADIAARTLVAPQELATGAMTALVGAPLFIFIAARFFK